MSTQTEQRQLLEPFKPKLIKQIDTGKYVADYVSWTDKIQRLMHLQLPYSWTIISLHNSGDGAEPVACHGRLTMMVDGVERTVDGIGQGRDAKTASTDAFSRACAFLGLGLHLWCQGGKSDGGYWVDQLLDRDVNPETGEVQA